MQIPSISLRKGRERSVLHRHPWIFSGGVEKEFSCKEGDIVCVKAHSGEILGYGFYSLHSQIRCRMFEWEKEPQDFEDIAYWQLKINEALNLRKAVAEKNGTDAYRLIHAEGDFIPGLIADRYTGLIVVQILISGIEKRKEIFFEALRQAGFNDIYLRSSSSSARQQDVSLNSGWISGERSSPILIKENGLLFNVDFVHGQKTGFFLDQRDNRAIVKEYAAGKKVLNAFSYTGGFSVYALAGGASEVHSLDISEQAAKFAQENVVLNFSTTNHRIIVKDCFEYLKDMESDQYDMIILDPPAFAKHAGAVAQAARGYKDINMRAVKKIRKGGMLFTFSCSQHISSDLFRKIVFGAAADAGRNVRILYQLHQPPDHPVNIYHPEGEYLKGLALWVE